MKIDSKTILEKLKKGELYLKAYIEAREDIEKEINQIESLPECPPEVKKAIKKNKPRGPSRTETDQKTIIKLMKHNKFPMTAKEIENKTENIPYQQINRTLIKLEKLGKIEQTIHTGRAKHWMYIQTIKVADPFLHESQTKQDFVMVKGDLKP